MLKHSQTRKRHGSISAMLLLRTAMVVQVELLADKNGGFVRMLGFELGITEGTGPKCQRFAGIVDDGILLKVVSLCTVPGRSCLTSSPASLNACSLALSVRVLATVTLPVLYCCTFSACDAPHNLVLACCCLAHQSSPCICIYTWSCALLPLKFNKS